MTRRIPRSHKEAWVGGEDINVSYCWLAGSERLVSETLDLKRAFFMMCHGPALVGRILR